MMQIPFVVSFNSADSVAGDLRSDEKREREREGKGGLGLAPRMYGINELP